MNRLEKAINSYNRVLEIEPDNLSAICNIGLAFLNMSYRDEAVKYCRKAISIDSSLFGAHLLSAMHCLHWVDMRTHTIVMLMLEIYNQMI